MPDDINATAFWAAGKLYAVAAMKAPCVMLDTDLICWKNIDTLLDGVDAAAIHREDIIPSIYPDKSAFSRSRGFDFDELDWTVQPLNTALCYFGSDEFRRYYTDTAIRFMRSAPQADDTLTYMVFAEQRLLTMCAEKKGIRIRALSDLPSLFGGGQADISHISGGSSSRCVKIRHFTRTSAAAAPHGSRATSPMRRRGLRRCRCFRYFLQHKKRTEDGKIPSVRYFYVYCSARTKSARRSVASGCATAFIVWRTVSRRTGLVNSS